MQQPPYPAPDFSLRDTNGNKFTLSDHVGSWIVLYFYPKDETPGCTIEACSFRDARDTLAELGAKIVGVSRDDAASHDNFMSRHKLNFTLLSDPDHKVMDVYGAWGPKMFGREGILRKTFLIDPKGTVVKAYGRVTPQGHGEQVIKDLKSLM